MLRSGYMQSLSPSRKMRDALHIGQAPPGDPPTLTNMEKLAAPVLQRPAKRNYPALVSALQTLGYSITGFIATAVVGLDGQPVAQVAVDDIDISQLCGYFSSILQGALGSLQDGGLGGFEDTVISSADRHVLIRLVSSDKDTFQVLITTRESEPLESLEQMANVEDAIAAALR